VDSFSLFLQLVLKQETEIDSVRTTSPTIREYLSSYTLSLSVSVSIILILSIVNYCQSSIVCILSIYRRSTVTVNIELFQYSDNIEVSSYHKHGLESTDKRRTVMDGCTSSSLANVGIHAPLPLMIPSFLSFVSDDLQILFLSLWLDVRSLSTLDVAISCHRQRPCWMTLLRRLRSPAIDDWGHSLSSLMWLSKRGISASRVQMKIDTSRVRVCDILLLETSRLVALDLRSCCNITDECVMDVIKRFPKLRSIDVGNCRLVTDAGVSALGHRHGQLPSIYLSDCLRLTDAGISALATGCCQLQSIEFSCCINVTDAGISALAAGCGQLHRIDLSGCKRVTDAGISALAAGCGQLQSVNLESCDEVTDAGVFSLGAGCSKLQSINLESCTKVTDAGIFSLGAGCGKLQRIDLTDCRLMTDAGISALAAGCGQLLSIFLGGCIKVTDAGISALGAGCGQLRCIDLTDCRQMQVYSRWSQDVASCLTLNLMAVLM
jgi:Leucine Rich repeat